MTTSVPNFNFLALLVFEIKRVSNNLMSGLPAPAVPRTLKLLCVLKVAYLARSNSPPKFQHRIYMHRGVEREGVGKREGRKGRMWMVGAGCTKKI